MNKKPSLWNLFAIYSVIFMANGVYLVSPAIDTLAKAFPQEAYSSVLLVYTIPSLIAFPFALISGRLLGIRVRYRRALPVIALVNLAAGSVPFFLDSLAPILVCRAVYGMSIGLLAPQGAALILSTYDGADRYRYTGYANFSIGIAGVVYSFLAGFLCDLGWRYVFLGHLVGLLPLLLIVFFLKEPEKEPAGTPEDGQDEKEPAVPLEAELVRNAPSEMTPEARRSRRKKVVRLVLFVMGVYLACQSQMLVASSIVAYEGLGDAKMTAVVLAGATVGTLLSGLVFNTYYRLVRRYRIPVAIFSCAVFTLPILVNSIPVMFLALTLESMALMFNFSMINLRASSFFPKSEAGKGTSIVQCSEKAGTFIATYFVNALVLFAGRAGFPSDPYKAPLLAGAVIYVVIALIDAFVSGSEVELPD